MTSPDRKEAQTETGEPTEAQMEAAALLVVLALDKVRQKKVAGGIDLIAQALAASHDEGHREGMKRAAEIARGSSGEYDFQAALAEGRDFDYGFHNGKNHAADSILAEIILSEAGEA